MEFTIKKTTEEKVNIKLPAYYKSSAFHFKIYSDKNCIQVCDDQIAVKHASLPFVLDTLVESNEEEFLLAYLDTQSYINLIVNKL